MYNVLFFPEDRIIKKPISDWVEELTIKAEQTRKKDDTITEAGTIAEILNQSALIYFSLGQYEAAKEICYLQINYFININKKAPNLHLLKYVMQPWVNLCRLDRAAGNINDLLKKLYQVANARQLLHALRSDPEFYSVLLLSRLLEPVKAYLKFNRYHELLRFVEKHKPLANPYHRAVLDEAEIIAYGQRGLSERALNLVEKSLSSSPSIFIHIFELRKYEINLREMKINAVYDPTHLYERSIKNIRSTHVNINDILYAIYLARLMLSHALINEAVTLLKNCYQTAIQLNDDHLIVESLLALYGVCHQEIDPDLIEQKLIAHHYETAYSLSREKISHFISKKILKRKKNTNINNKLSRLHQELQYFQV